MELFILILPISGGIVYTVSKEIFPPTTTYSNTFDRISKELPTKGLTKLEVSGQMITWKRPKIIAYLQDQLLVTGFWMGRKLILSTTGLLVLGAKSLVLLGRQVH
jgi:hypothetical protein